MKNESSCKRLAGQYLISKFADQLGVIVVCFDDLCFATGQMRCALDEVRPQGSLGQKDLVWIQVHLSDHFVGHLRNNAVQHLQQFNNSLKTEKLTLDMNQNKNTIQIKKKRNLYWLWQRCLRWFFVSPRGWWSCSKSCWCVCVASCPPQKWEVLLFHCRRCELRSPLQSDMKDKTIRVSFTWEQPGGRLHNRSTSQQPRHSGVAFSQTFQFDSKFGEGLLHTQTLPLPHEAVVDVNGYDLVLVQGFVQKSCTHGGVHAAAQQNLWERSQTEALRR